MSYSSRFHQLIYGQIARARNSEPTFAKCAGIGMPELGEDQCLTKN